MGHDANFANAEKAITTAKLDAKLAKMEYVQVCSKKRRTMAVNLRALSLTPKS